MRFFRRLLPALLLVVFAAPLAAQQVRGRVVDDGGQSVKSAHVRLQDEDGHPLAAVRTDDEGRFELRVPRQGTYRLHARRIGYGEALTDALTVGGRISVDVTLQLSVRAVALDPLTITARRERSRHPRLVSVGFYDRQAQGQGEFFEREDIERQRPLQMSVLVAQVPGIMVTAGGGGSFSSGDVVMVRGTRCLPSVWLDGRLARAGARLESARPGPPPGRHLPSARTEAPPPRMTLSMDELVTPHEVEAVEVYRGPAEVPAIFAFTGGACGAVVVWTQFHAGIAARTR